MKTELMTKLSEIPDVYNDYFYSLSIGEEPEPPDTIGDLFPVDKPGELLGETLGAEFEELTGNTNGEIAENSTLSVEGAAEIFDAAKIGFTLIKISKTGPFWATGERRGI